MRNVVRTLIAAATLGLTITTGAVQPAPKQAGSTGPVQLSRAAMSKIVAGKITQVNGGGNTPKGEANGVPAKNPAGHAPPGHN